MINSVYEQHIPDKRSPFIFHTDIPEKHVIALNWHENMELLYCIEGKGIVRCDDEEYSFKKGEIFIIESNMLHGAYDIDGAFKYRCLIIDKFFQTENGLEVENVHFPRLIEDSELAAGFERLVEAFYSKGRYKGALIRHAVLGFMISLYEKYSSAYDESGIGQKRESLERIKSVIVYIKKNYAEKITLDDIASSVKTSKFYLSREFKQITGQTIFEFLNIIRCKEARRLIKSGLSVSEAALSCGFENMSYFTRTYKRLAGELPSRLKE